jgi:hypothetical protein
MLFEVNDGCYIDEDETELLESIMTRSALAPVRSSILLPPWHVLSICCPPITKFTTFGRKEWKRMKNEKPLLDAYGESAFQQKLCNSYYNTEMRRHRYR